MLTYLERAKQEPPHVRRRIAYLAASGATALIFVAWLTVAVTSGTFAIEPSPSYTQGTSQLNDAFAATQTHVNTLLGAAAAFQSNSQDGSSGIKVDTVSSTTVNDTPTTLPF
jgi:hypothetical protein